MWARANCVLTMASASSQAVSKGDTVVYGKYSGTEIEIKNAKHLIMRESELLGIVE